MLSPVDFGLTSSLDETLFEDHKCPDCRVHFGEVASYLSAHDFDALMVDLDAYSRVGLVTERVEDMKRRAQCIADADRIIARLDLEIADLAGK